MGSAPAGIGAECAVLAADFAQSGAAANTCRAPGCSAVTVAVSPRKRPQWVPRFVAGP